MKNEDVTLDFQVICNDSFLQELFIYVTYQTKGWTNAIYSLSYDCQSNLLEATIAQSYEYEKNTLTKISPKLQKLNLGEITWREKTSPFSPTINHLYIIKVYPCLPNTIQESNVLHILENIQLEVDGYLKSPRLTSWGF